jgi:hypothetical protein
MSITTVRLKPTHFIIAMVFHLEQMGDLRQVEVTLITMVSLLPVERMYLALDGQISASVSRMTSLFLNLDGKTP